MSIALLASLAGQGMQMLGGLGKMAIGTAQMMKAKRPSDIKYEIPSGFMDYLSRADMLAREGMPGEGAMRDRIGAQVSGAVGEIGRAADSSTGALGALQNIYGKSMEAVNDLSIRGAEFRRRAQETAMGAQKEHAMYQDKSWEYNVNIPYQRRMNEYHAQKRSGMQNIWGGLDAFGAGSTNAGSGMSQQSQMDKLIEAIKGIGVGGGE